MYMCFQLQKVSIHVPTAFSWVTIQYNSGVNFLPWLWPPFIKSDLITEPVSRINMTDTFWGSSAVSLKNVENNLCQAYEKPFKATQAVILISQGDTATGKVVFKKHDQCYHFLCSWLESSTTYSGIEFLSSAAVFLSFYPQSRSSSSATLFLMCFPSSWFILGFITRLNPHLFTRFVSHTPPSFLHTSSCVHTLTACLSCCVDEIFERLTSCMLSRLW